MNGPPLVQILKVKTPLFLIRSRSRIRLREAWICGPDPYQNVMAPQHYKTQIEACQDLVI
jgi:hypothetical protein